KEYGKSEVYKLESHVSAIGRCHRVVLSERCGTKRNGHLSTGPVRHGWIPHLITQLKFSNITLILSAMSIMRSTLRSLKRPAGNLFLKMVLALKTSTELKMRSEE